MTTAVPGESPACGGSTVPLQCDAATTTSPDCETHQDGWSARRIWNFGGPSRSGGFAQPTRSSEACDCATQAETERPTLMQGAARFPLFRHTRPGQVN
jgi:hypothetical protein